MKQDSIPSSEQTSRQPLERGFSRLHSHRSFGIKASLVSGVLLIVSLTAAIVYIPWSLTSKRNLKAIVAQTNEEIVMGASQEVKRLLGSASTANNLVQNSFYYDLVDFEDPVAREAFFLSILESNPDFSWVQLGYANGDFLGAQRLSDGKLRIHFRDWNESTGTTQEMLKTYVSIGGDDNVVETTAQMDSPFDSTTRPWYTAAVEQPDEQAWSVYIYRSTRRPGVDATVTISRDDEIYGVVGVGIGLGQLSQFLRNELWHQSGGEVFVLNADHEIVASTDITETDNESTDTTTVNLQPIDESANPLLQHVSRALSKSDVTEMLQAGHVDYVDEDSGKSYYISLTSLGQLDWMVGTIVPADIYLGRIQRERQILFVVISLFILTAAGLAVLASDQWVAKPILAVARAASDIEAEKFEMESLSSLAVRKDEFGQLARVFQKMGRQVLERQQSLKKQVSALKIEIDEVKQKQRVKEVVDSDFFQDLTSKVVSLRQRASDRTSNKQA
ncbi:MAG: cache domain-containing protein [Cyanobacteria bacterium P01_D01_bin.1]